MGSITLKVLALCFLQIFVVCKVNLYGQKIGKFDGKSIICNTISKVKIPHSIDDNCQFKFIYSIDSLYVFKLQDEGCDTQIYICKNSNTGKILWYASGAEYNSLEFDGQFFYYFKKGTLFCKAIHSGNLEWSQYINEDFEWVDIEIIPNNRAFISSTIWDENNARFDHFLITVDFITRRVVTAKLNIKDSIDLLGINLKSDFIELGNYKGAYLLRINDFYTDSIIANFTIRDIHKIPSKYRIIQYPDSVNNYLFLSKSEIDRDNNSITDSLFSYDINSGAQNFVFVAKRFTNRYQFAYINDCLKSDNGILIYLQLDSLDQNMKTLRQSIIMYDLSKKVIIWKHALPIQKFNENENFSIVGASSDGNFTYIVLNNTIYKIKSDSGNIEWKYDSSLLFSEVYFSQNNIICQAYSRNRHHRFVTIYDKNRNYTISKNSNHRILQVDYFTDTFIAEKKSTVIKLKIIPVGRKLRLLPTNKRA